jgi:hypothetical protein
MRRIFISAVFAVFLFAVALFLWQKQVENYNFSFEKEKEAFKGFGDTVKEFQENLPFDEFELSTTTIEVFEEATSTGF